MYTNDAAQTSVVLSIQGTIKTDVDLEPRALRFGDVNDFSDAVQEATISTNASSLVKIVSATSRSEYLEINTSRFANKAKKGLRVKVRLKEELPEGGFRSRIVVKTTSATNPTINIPVFAHVVGDMQLNPKVVSYGLLDAPLSEAIERSVHLSYRGEGQLSILSASSPHPGISVKVEPIEDGRKFAVVVTLQSSVSGILRTEAFGYH